MVGQEFPAAGLTCRSRDTGRSYAIDRVIVGQGAPGTFASDGLVVIRVNSQHVECWMMHRFNEAFEITDRDRNNVNCESVTREQILALKDRLIETCDLALSEPDYSTERRMALGRCVELINRINEDERGES